MHVGPRRRSLSSLRREAAVMTHTMRVVSVLPHAARPDRCYVDTDGTDDDVLRRYDQRATPNAKGSTSCRGEGVLYIGRAPSGGTTPGTGAAGGWPRGRVAARGAPLTTTIGNMGADDAAPPAGSSASWSSRSLVGTLKARPTAGLRGGKRRRAGDQIMPSPARTNDWYSQHSHHSSFREKLIEHLLIGELLMYSWRKRDCSLEISRPEVDRAVTIS